MPGVRCQAFLLIAQGRCEKIDRRAKPDGPLTLPLSPETCMDRGHGKHMFGDMVNTLRDETFDPTHYRFSLYDVKGKTSRTKRGP